VPNLVRQPLRDRPESYTNPWVWGEGSDYAKMLAKRTLENTELTWMTRYPLHDAWGFERKKTQALGSDWLYRIVSPVSVQETKTFVADQVIRNWNNAHEKKAIFPISPPKSYRLNGETKWMTEPQFSEFAQVAGETARFAIEQGKVKLDPNKPSLSQIDYIRTISSDARAAAKAMLVKKWNAHGRNVSSRQLARQVAQETLGRIAYSAASPSASDEHVRLADGLRVSQRDWKITLEKNLRDKNYEWDTIDQWTFRLLVRLNAATPKNE
jgi:hypothetical protein